MLTFTLVAIFSSFLFLKKILYWVLFFLSVTSCSPPGSVLGQEEADGAVAGWRDGGGGGQRSTDLLSSHTVPVYIYAMSTYRLPFHPHNTFFH